VLVVGGTSAVGSTAVTRLRGHGVTSTARVSGRDGPSTAVAVATAFRNPVPANQVVLVPTAPSAWSVIGAGQARLTGFTGPTTLPPVTGAWLTSRKPGRALLIADLRAANTAVLSQVYAAGR
jgi:hypothetical protein